jgi:lipopolysaccharide O-acetyltransferase
MKPQGSVLQRLKKFVSSDPPLWAIWLLLGRISSKAKSKCLAWIFHAPGLYLGPGSLIKGANFIRFGRDFYVHGHLWMEAVVSYRDQCFNPKIEIGDAVSFSQGVHISCIERITIGRNVLIGSGVYISDHNHGSYRGPTPSSPDEPPTARRLTGGPVDIGDNVWIGDNVVIVGPLSIGRGSIVGANSVVRANVPENVMVAGIPARHLRRFDITSGQWQKI